MSLPHVGDMAFTGEEDKYKNLYKMLKNEIKHYRNNDSQKQHKYLFRFTYAIHLDLCLVTFIRIF